MKDKLYPFDISRLLYTRGRNVFGFAIIFSPDAFYQKGILYELSKILFENNIGILYISFTRNSPDTDMGILLFLDLTDSSISVKETKKLLASVKHVKNVYIIEPFEDIIVDTFFFPITLLGERAIILRKPFFESFISEVQKKMGRGGSAVLYHIGYYIGSHVYDSHKRIIGNDPQKILNFGKIIYKNVGYGIMKELKIKKEGIITLKILNNFECEINKNLNLENKESHFMRGILAGWFEKYLGKKVMVKETKCIARGDDYCEYYITTIE